MTPNTANTIETGWLKAITLEPPSLKDNTADVDRLKSALSKSIGGQKIDISFRLAKKLPGMLRQWQYRVRCILFRDDQRWFLAGVTSPDHGRRACAISVDLGTTRVVLRLLNLADGQKMAETSFDNPQIKIGPDILERIHFAENDGGLEQLQQLIVEGLNRHLKQLAESCGIRCDDIYLLAVAGNTAMTHLFLGLEPRWIIREPYIPVLNRPGVLSAQEIGIQVNEDARVLVFPNIGSYFGGDLIAGILASGLHSAEDTGILVDVGTNAEVVLGNKYWLIACAGAAGPALEGSVTRMGMIAGPGVIDSVTIDPKTAELEYHTIDELDPIGICGSGLIDLAAQLFLAGMLDIRGRFVPSRCGRRLQEKDGIFHFMVVSAREFGCPQDMTISQVDIDSLIRSKAAMYTILETLTTSVGLQLQDLATFHVGGTFGSFIKPLSAITIGMLPDLPVESYKALGNTSLEGATLVLQSPQYLSEIDGIRDRITYMELNVNQDFMNRFSAAKFLPHTTPAFFPSVKIYDNKRSIPGRN
jgi:uncharacterized 2Fe-2S/4Fe-4S cluster protein (DUF4445 family)